MVFIAYDTEINLQKWRICHENSKYAPDENVYAHFCSRWKAANFCHPWGGGGCTRLPRWFAAIVYPYSNGQFPVLGLVRTFARMVCHFLAQFGNVKNRQTRVNLRSHTLCSRFLCHGIHQKGRVGRGGSKNYLGNAGLDGPVFKKGLPYKVSVISMSLGRKNLHIIGLR